MDSLETVSCIVDDFLNFSPDLDDPSPKEDGSSPQEDEITYQKSPQNLCFGSQTNTHQAQLDIIDRYTDSFPAVGEEELEWLLNENAFPPFEPFSTPFQSPKHQSPVSVLESGVGGSGFRVPGRPRSQRKRRRQFAVVGIFGMLGGEKRRRCLHCLAEKTPQWRAGPLGPKTLCNACGVRFKAGRLVPEYRPASSPTFSSELHSNSHRKILEMRRKKQKTAPENG